VSEIYEEELKWHCKRYTKNQKEPDFTDQELLTKCIYLQLSMKDDFG
jgi:hypothetical protein